MPPSVRLHNATSVILVLAQPANANGAETSLRIVEFVFFCGVADANDKSRMHGIMSRMLTALLHIAAVCIYIYITWKKVLLHFSPTVRVCRSLQMLFP